jgi:DNA helicase-2/ATP-dependent DNA helicase PcrA
VPAPPDKDLSLPPDAPSDPKPPSPPEMAPEASADMERAEVRDVVAWTRLLADPSDASAVVRALARPPIELRQVDLARVIQIARRRKLDMIAALDAAIESSQVPPEARARIQRFLELHRAASAALDAARPDLLARAALGAEREPRGGGSSSASSTSQDGCEGALRDMQRIVREEVLADVARIGARLSELRLDTELDVAHGVARYLELLKLSALTQRPAEQSVSDALADVNARLLAAATAIEREILQSSPLDGTLLSAGLALAPGEEGGAGAGGYDEQAARVQALSPRGEPSLAPFLRRRGAGLALSASDIETYRGCPLRYKFARVLRIPSEPTLHQRFGIVVHQVLERYHADGGESLAQLLGLLDAVWRRSGLGDGEHERELREKARSALTRYHARLHGQDARPVWFERQFSFRLGPHHLRGRVDRVDRLSGDGEEYELIDYKTSRPRAAEELREDVQLSLYALAAREDWRLPSSRQAYYYVLDDVKVPVPCGEPDADTVTDLVLEVGEGILAQAFEPTPSAAACRICDYRIVCPAAEG